ncbi:MAG: ABC transporter ATP-binding protein [Acidimicrobiales bacterium]|nr:ABC transporter ATP-binding protein [Acidimicrobiales bacterium]
MLELSNLEVVYNDVILVLRGLSITVPKGDIVALLGSNGAGKTTTARAITGLLGVHEGDVTKGSIKWKGEDITHSPPVAIVKSGISQVMEGRRCFGELTVDENLSTGSFTNKANHKERYARVMDLFPRLGERKDQLAGYMSGGEQQMLAIGRALMSGPELLILDEPSLGLAPLLVQQVRDVIKEINEEGTSILLIEQNAMMALSIANTGYIMENGKIVMDGDAQKLLGDDDVKEFYLGLHGGEDEEHLDGGRKSFKNVKHYKRKKKWAS